MSRARDVVEVIARTLADQPDGVRVTEQAHRGQVLIELFMAPGDLGRVIGRQGRTAAALRTLRDLDWIDTQRRRITVLDREALAARASIQN